MNFNEFMFFIQFVVFVGCFVAILYNLSQRARYMETFKLFVVYIIFSLCYLVSIVITTTDAALNQNETILGFSVLLMVQRGIFILGTVLLGLSFFWIWKNEAMGRLEARNSLQERRGG